MAKAENDHQSDQDDPHVAVVENVAKAVHCEPPSLYSFPFSLYAGIRKTVKGYKRNKVDFRNGNPHCQILIRHSH